MSADKSARMLNPKQIARRLLLSPRQIYRLLNDKDRPIPHYRIGKLYRISEDEFIEWLELSKKK